MTLIDTLERWIAPLKRRVLLMIGKATLSAIKDTTGIQVVQVNLGHGEVIDDVERVQNFGFTSHPKPGAQAVVVFVGGNRDHPIVLAADDTRYRVKINPGDSAMYNSQGMQVRCKGGVIELGDGGVLLATDGVITGKSICPFTGLPHQDFSTKVRAKKG